MIPPAATPERFKTARATILVDRFMTAFIKIGGIGIILAVLAIGVFIIAQVVPLFRSATVEPVPTSHEVDLRSVLTQGDESVVLGLDEWGERPFVVSRSGLLAFCDVVGAATKHEKAIPITEGRVVTSSAYDVERQHVALGFADGSALAFAVKYSPEYADGKRFVRSELGPLKKVVLDPAGGTVSSLSWVGKSDVEEVAAVVVPLQGKPKLLVQRGDQPAEDLTNLITGVPSKVIADNRGDALVVVSQEGDVSYLFRTSDGFRVRQIFRPFADTASQAITSMAWLFGDVSLVATTAEGRNRQFSLFIKPGEDKRTFGLTKEFDRLPAGARFTSISVRNKAFLVATGNHASLRFGTSAATRWEADLPYVPAQGVINAKYNRIAFLGEDARLRTLVLDDPHPEAGIRAFFGKVWYEGFAAPKYEWQSSGGTDDFEPKLSMINLMFGTFKATFYALLFAIPIALLGAIYTAEFMAALLSNEIHNTDKISVFVSECHRMGLEILPPDLNASQLRFAPEITTRKLLTSAIPLRRGAVGDQEKCGPNIHATPDLMQMLDRTSSVLICLAALILMPLTPTSPRLIAGRHRITDSSSGTHNPAHVIHNPPTQHPQFTPSPAPGTELAQGSGPGVCAL